MSEYEPHICPICHQTVMWRIDIKKPRESESDILNDYHYSRCQHCGRYFLSASDCCPYCGMPYCGDD